MTQNGTRPVLCHLEYDLLMTVSPEPLKMTRFRVFLDPFFGDYPTGDPLNWQKVVKKWFPGVSRTSRDHPNCQKKWHFVVKNHNFDKFQKVQKMTKMKKWYIKWWNLFHGLPGSDSSEGLKMAVFDPFFGPFLVQKLTKKWSKNGSKMVTQNHPF